MRGEGKELAGLDLLFTAGTASGLAFNHWNITFSYQAAAVSLPAAVLAAVLALAALRGRLRSAAGTRPAIPFLLGMSFFSAGIFSSSVSCLTDCLPTGGNGQIFLHAAADGSVRHLKSMIEAVPFRDRECNALVTALITGDKSQLSPGTSEAFRKSGAAHILALSGMHLGVIYLMLTRIFSVLGNSPAAVTARSSMIVAVSGFYTLMTGAGASIARAFLFISMNELARCTGRKRLQMNVFFTSLMLQAAFSPDVIKSVGFQLSYLAMAGIYILYPRMKEWYREEPGTTMQDNPAGKALKHFHPMKRLWDMASMSISCQIFTAPAVWYYFGTFPPYFIITNLIAVPLSAAAINLALTVIVLESFGICPDFLVQGSEAVIRLMYTSLGIISGM